MLADILILKRPVGNELLEEAEDIGAVLVCLSEHGLSSLHEDIVLSVLGHFLGHISIADGGLSVGYILGCSGQVGSGVLEAGLSSTDGGLLVESLYQSCRH